MSTEEVPETEEEKICEYMKQDITKIIRKNQTLIRKKGLLKRLLEDGIIRDILEQCLNGELDSEDGPFLDSNEKCLLEKLIKKNNFDLDETIEKIFSDAGDTMENVLDDEPDKQDDNTLDSTSLESEDSEATDGLRTELFVDKESGARYMRLDQDSSGPKTKATPKTKTKYNTNVSYGDSATVPGG